MIGHLFSDRYKIINPLGAGGMGQTYVAEDTQRPGNPKCVVKQLKPASNDPNFLVTARRLFTGEAEILEKLGHHDQIPRLLAHFERDEEFYIVQEFIDGQPLSAELPLGQRWAEPQVVALLKDILVILESIHGQGVIHRDIKPDNIIRRKHDGKLVLIDFGAVKQIRMQQATAVGQVSVTVAIGTPGYMPTEQSSGKPRPSSDIYALGMVAIQALTGLFPSQLREDEDGEAIWRDQAEVSDGLATVLTTMTRHYFKHRYQSASEVLQALQDLESPNLAANSSYTPTQAISNSGYMPTEVTPIGYTPAQANPDGQTGTSNGRSSIQPPQIEQPRTLDQQPQRTFPQHKPTRTSSSNKLLLAGAIFLSMLIAGVLFYFNSTPPPQTDSSDIEKTPSPSVTPTPSPSATPTPSQTPSPSPSPSKSPVASPSSPSLPSPPTPTTPSTERDTNAEAARRAQDAEDARRRVQNADVERRRAQEVEDARRQRAQAEEDARRRTQDAEDARRRAQDAEDARRRAQAEEDARRRTQDADVERRRAEENGRDPRCGTGELELDDWLNLGCG